MILHDNDNKIRISGIPSFDLDKTLNCGQCFRWERDDDGVYTGVVSNRAVSAFTINDTFYISDTAENSINFWHSYFDLKRNYSEIQDHLCISPFMRSAINFGNGIRILKQDPWEVLCSFIISQNNHIPRIKSIINVLCEQFGNLLTHNGTKHYTFPSAQTLAGLSADALSPLRCGYRAKYIISAARAVASYSLSFNELSSLPADMAREKLMYLPGVGRKVADCVLLFGFHMLDVFPADVWIKRALSEYFPEDFDISCFSPYSGIAQQHIFYYTRNKIGR